MTDSEMLKLAARATGRSISQHIGPAYDYWYDDADGLEWDSLESNGDALQLAIDLQMHLSFGFGEATASTISTTLAGVFPKECGEPMGGIDKAVRRVITRAAAEHQRIKDNA